MAQQVEDEKSESPNITRNPYQKPELLVYGNIREITKNVGSKGALDGGGGAGAGPKTSV